MVTLSLYVPAATLMVSFGDAAAIAAPMVAKQPDEAGAAAFTQKDAAYIGPESAAKITPDVNMEASELVDFRIITAPALDIFELLNIVVTCSFVVSYYNLRESSYSREVMRKNTTGVVCFNTKVVRFHTFVNYLSFARFAMSTQPARPAAAASCRPNRLSPFQPA